MASPRILEFFSFAFCRDADKVPFRFLLVLFTEASFIYNDMYKLCCVNSTIKFRQHEQKEKRDVHRIQNRWTAGNSRMEYAQGPVFNQLVPFSSLPPTPTPGLLPTSLQCTSNSEWNIPPNLSQPGPLWTPSLSIALPSLHLHGSRAPSPLECTNSGLF